MVYLTLIQRLDGTTYDLNEYGIRTRDVLISAPTPEHELGKVEGSHGVIDYGTTYGARDISCLYRATSHDFIDFSLLRDEIFNIFRTEESFYLIEKRLPGKRWLVKVANPYQIPQRNVFGNFDVDFIGIKGMSESIGTTAQDIQREGINSNSELWGFGMGLESVDESLLYNHTASSDTDFLIYNAGNIPVHPFEQELKIVIDNIVGATDKFELKNKTNGTVFRVNEFISRNQKIVLDGANVTSNGMQYLRSTNKGFIELDPGYNLMTITGARRADVVFDFRFYYS